MGRADCKFIFFKLNMWGRIELVLSLSPTSPRSCELLKCNFSKLHEREIPPITVKTPHRPEVCVDGIYYADEYHLS